MADLRYQSLDFDQLDGWAEDDQGEALAVFLNTCGDLAGEDWSVLCDAAGSQDEAKAFFENHFQPVMISDGSSEQFTAYFEPELNGARIRSERYAHPVYALPDEAKANEPWLPRRTLLEDGHLENRGLELAWVDDPVELFFLQIQGSGRIRLEKEKAMRVGYAGTNGQPYRSIGKELLRRGVLTAETASAEAIKSWMRKNPDAGRALMFHNPSYVFFRQIDVPTHLGPLGAMNRSITPMRSIAVDPNFVPLGAPVWIEKGGADPIHRLMVAQDTGSAIKGPQRADIFFGTGAEAGARAGEINDPGRMVVLLPFVQAEALLRGERP